MKLTQENLRNIIEEVVAEAVNISKSLRVSKGDTVLVGFEGTRRKYVTSIRDVKPNGDIVDLAGNVYDPAGRLKRRSQQPYKFGWLTGSDPGNKNVQLQIYDIEDHTEDFRETLKRILFSSFDKLTLDQMKQIASVSNVQIGSRPYREKRDQ
jgi:hypothetical protein